MKPNIDRKGRIARTLSGLLCVLFGPGVWIFSWPDSMTYRWVISIAAIIFGVFQWYEARKSWCIVRACGFKTPM